jgi:NADH-quinone oxidoreductase subunit L
MTVPLVVLAAGSVLAGWIGVPKLWGAFSGKFRLFEHWLAPVFPAGAAHAAGGHAGHHDAATEWLLTGLSVTVAVAGILAARYFYLVRPSAAEAVRRAAGPLYKTLLNKWYVDELYDALFVNGLAKGGGRLLGRFDNGVVDGGVNGTGWLTRFTSRISIWWDTWIIDGAVRLGSFLVKVSSYPVRVAQSGYVQSYALVFVLGVAAIFGYYLTR